MMISFREASFLGLILAASAPFTINIAAAKDLFTINLAVSNGAVTQTGSSSFKTITNLADSLTDRGLQRVVSAYTPTSGANATLNIRGLPATASYAPNGTTLTFVVPSAGINKQFVGATRDESKKKFEDFLKKDGSSLLSKMLQQLAAQSPIDPVAGNPNSLASQIVAAGFGVGSGFGGPSMDLPPNGRTPAGGFENVPGLYNAGGDVGFATAGGYNTQIISVPQSYTYSFDDPRYALIFDGVGTYLSTQGAVSAQASFGLGLRIPVMENWYLTPTARAGATGSVDLGAAALIYTGGLTSLYNIYFGDLKLGIANGVNYVKTTGISIGSVNINYDLTNTVFKNGASLEGSLDFTLFDQPTSWQVYFVDTHIAGDRLYINHYDEIGVSIGTRRGLNSQDWDSLRLGFGVTFANNYNAFKASLSYRF